MAYSVNWITKVLTVPTSDLTLVGGTRYQLQDTDFLKEIRRLEAALGEGMWAPGIIEHSDTRVDFAGTDFAPFDEMINGYTWRVSGSATRVDWKGSVTNFNDTIIATGVSFVPEPLPGLVLKTIDTGGGGGGDGLTLKEFIALK